MLRIKSVRGSRSRSFEPILMMESVENGSAVESCGHWEYYVDDRSPMRADVMPQGFRPKTHVRPGVVIMRDPRLQHGLEMTLIERNEEVQAFATQRPAETFAQ